MARPATSIETAAGHRTKKEKSIRLNIQDKLAGEKMRLKYPANLTTNQKKIYKWLFTNLSCTGFLSELDTETMRNAAVVIDRLNAIDNTINESVENLTDRSMVQVRDVYYKQYLNVCKELCLSPAARAKMGTLAVNNALDETDPLMEALKND